MGPFSIRSGGREEKKKNRPPNWRPGSSFDIIIKPQKDWKRSRADMEREEETLDQGQN